MSDPAPVRATRSSARVKAVPAAAAAVPPAKTTKPKSAAKPKSATVKPAPKPKKTVNKRTHEDSDIEEANKSTKKAKVDDDADVKALDEKDDEVADDEPKKMVNLF